MSSPEPTPRCDWKALHTACVAEMCVATDPDTRTRLRDTAALYELMLELDTAAQKRRIDARTSPLMPVADELPIVRAEPDLLAVVFGTVFILLGFK